MLMPGGDSSGTIGVYKTGTDYVVGGSQAESDSIPLDSSSDSVQYLKASSHFSTDYAPEATKMAILKTSHRV